MPTILTFRCQVERNVIGIAEDHIQGALINLLTLDQALQLLIPGKADESQQVRHGSGALPIEKSVIRFGVLGVYLFSGRFDHALDKLVRDYGAMNI
jgi:hypothetical protein